MTHVICETLSFYKYGFSSYFAEGVYEMFYITYKQIGTMSTSYFVKHSFSRNMDSYIILKNIPPSICFGFLKALKDSKSQDQKM